MSGLNNFSNHHFVRGQIVVLLLAMLLWSCSTDPTGSDPDGIAPELPPTNTMLMDFSGFAGATLKPADQPSKTMTRQNWTYSALKAGIWNVLLAVTFVVPVTAYLEAFNHQPVQQSDGTWIWSYSYTVPANNVTYDAELHGRLTANGSEWEMYITSSNGQFNNYLWFSGQANLTLTNGTWTLNQAVGEQPFILVEWQRTTDNQIASIRYTDIRPGAAENGRYIHYGINTDPLFDTFYDIYEMPAANMVDIEWLRSTGEGRVKDQAHFGDDAWHCWDSNQDDVACQ